VTGWLLAWAPARLVAFRWSRLTSESQVATAEPSFAGSAAV